MLGTAAVFDHFLPELRPCPASDSVPLPVAAHMPVVMDRPVRSNHHHHSRASPSSPSPSPSSPSAAAAAAAAVFASAAAVAAAAALLALPLAALPGAGAGGRLVMVANASPCTLARWVRSLASRMKHFVQPGKVHLQGCSAAECSACWPGAAQPCRLAGWQAVCAYVSDGAGADGGRQPVVAAGEPIHPYMPPSRPTYVLHACYKAPRMPSSASMSPAALHAMHPGEPHLASQPGSQAPCTITAQHQPRQVLCPCKLHSTACDPHLKVGSSWLSLWRCSLPASTKALPQPGCSQAKLFSPWLCMWRRRLPRAPKTCRAVQRGAGGCRGVHGVQGDAGGCRGVQEGCGGVQGGAGGCTGCRGMQEGCRGVQGGAGGCRRVQGSRGAGISAGMVDGVCCCLLYCSCDAWELGWP